MNKRNTLIKKKLLVLFANQIISSSTLANEQTKFTSSIVGTNGKNTNSIILFSNTLSTTFENELVIRKTKVITKTSERSS